MLHGLPTIDQNVRVKIAANIPHTTIMTMSNEYNIVSPNEVILVLIHIDMVLCHHGYVRLSCLPYYCDSDELGVHLTNQYILKRHPNFKEIETI